MKFKKLREAWAAMDGGWGSRDVLYDMTNGWVFKLRLFGEEEKQDWDDQLEKVVTKEDGAVVGAQWDDNKAKEEPPQSFEEGVKYRPIFERNPEHVV